MKEYFSLTKLLSETFLGKTLLGHTLTFYSKWHQEVPSLDSGHFSECGHGANILALPASRLRKSLTNLKPIGDPGEQSIITPPGFTFYHKLCRTTRRTRYFRHFLYLLDCLSPPRRMLSWPNQIDQKIVKQYVRGIQIIDNVGRLFLWIYSTFSSNYWVLLIWSSYTGTPHLMPKSMDLILNQSYLVPSSIIQMSYRSVKREALFEFTHDLETYGIRGGNFSQQVADCQLLIIIHESGWIQRFERFFFNLHCLLYLLQRFGFFFG